MSSHCSGRAIKEALSWCSTPEVLRVGQCDQALRSSPQGSDQNGRLLSSIVQLEVYKIMLSHL